MKNRTKILKILIILIVFSLLWSNYNYFYNTHFHIDSKGRFVLHSHPYSKNSASRDLPNHHHNKNEYFALHVLQRIFSILFILLFIIFLFISQKKKPSVTNVLFANKNLLNRNISPRGPPLFFGI